MRRTVIEPLLFKGAVFLLLCSCGGRPEQPELKVFFSSTGTVAGYDPADVRNSREYFLLENLYSPLLEYSASSNLISGAAASFEWSGGEARFRMRPGLKTAGGTPISARDAEVSLKRLFIKGGEKYAVLRDLLCGPRPLKGLDDPCPGLEASGDGSVLIMRPGSRRTFLFRFLANITYAVIPAGSIDGSSLEIRDYRETSGPYYVHSDNGGGDIELRANPGHYRYSPDLPQKVRLVPLEGHPRNREVLELLRSGRADYLTNGIVLSPADKAAFVSENPGYSVQLSQPTRMVFVVFTERGLRRLTAEERFFIAKKLRAHYAAKGGMVETPSQIFRMEGGLSRERLAEIRAKLEAPGPGVIRKSVAADRLYNYFAKDEKEISEWMPGIVYADIVKYRTGKSPEADFYILGSEIGFQDDVGLMAHYLESDFFGMTPGSKREWFAAYLAAPGKPERMEMLRELHYRTLAGAVALPLGLQPYASVARAPWRFEPRMAGDPLWRLKWR